MSRRKLFVPILLLLGMGSFLAGCAPQSPASDSPLAGTTDVTAAGQTPIGHETAALTPTATLISVPMLSTDTNKSLIWYDAHGEFWTMDEDGANRTPVPNSDCCASMRLSPGRTQCPYYRSDGKGKWEAGIVKLSESCEPIIFLSDMSTEDFMYRWSSDDEYVSIAPSYPTESGRYDELYIIELDSGTVFTIELDLIYEFSWLPGKHRLSVQADGFQDRESFGWYIVDPDGTKVQTVYEDAPAEYIDYSPDGQRVAFVAFAPEGSRGMIGRVSVCDIDGRRCEQVTPDWGPYEYGSAWWPRWSPDGNKIVFYGEYSLESAASSVPERIEGVFVVEVNTGEQKLLYEDVVGGPAVWSPDGTEVVLGPMTSKSPNAYRLSVETGERIVLEGSKDVSHILAWAWANK